MSRCFTLPLALFKSDSGKLGGSLAERDAEMIGNMEHAAYKERLKELCLFSLTKKKQSSGITAAYKYLSLTLSSLQLVFW